MRILSLSLRWGGEYDDLQGIKNLEAGSMKAMGFLIHCTNGFQQFDARDLQSVTYSVH